MNLIAKNKLALVILLPTALFASVKTTLANETFSYITVPPRNTVEESASAKKFVRQLKKIVEAKDLRALMRHIDPDIHLSFGGDAGTVDFLRYWNLLEKPENSELWQELNRILKLGGVMEDKKFITFPYLFTDWPDEFDAFEYQAITGSRVTVRDAPSTEAKVIRQITYEIVRPIIEDSDDQPRTWYKIETHDKKVGYVHRDYIRSAIDYRMFFTKSCDDWKMTTLIAGD